MLKFHFIYLVEILFFFQSFNFLGKNIPNVPDISFSPLCDEYIANISGNNIICEGDPAILTFSFIGGTGPYDLTFTANGIQSTLENIQHGQSISLPITQVTTYELFTIEDSEGCPGTPGSSFTVVVIPLPEAFPTNPLYACEIGTSSEAEFNLSLANNDINGGSGLPVNWYIDEPGNLAIPNPFSFISSSTTVYAATANGGCSSISIPVNLVVIPNFSPDLFSTNLNLCPNTTTILNVVDDYESYLWSTTDTTKSIEVGFGNYSVTVTTPEGCQGVNSVTVNLSPVIEISCIVEQNETTPDSDNGEVAVLVTGGIAPFEVVWSGVGSDSIMVTGENEFSIGSLDAGTYTLNVTDAFGCSSMCPYVIEALNCNLQVEVDTQDLDCYEDGSGSAEITIEGGNPPFDLEWEINSQEEMIDPFSLAAGFYDLTITDAIGCSDMTSFSIGQPDALSLTCNIQNEVSIVGGSDGLVQLLFTGGTIPYHLSWTGGTNGEDDVTIPGEYLLGNLVAGAYTVLIMDDNQCEYTCTFNIIEPVCDFEVEVSMIDVTCYNASNGAIDLDLNGGESPISIFLNGNIIENPSELSGLSDGTYNLLVQDAIGCGLDTTLIINQPEDLILSCTSIPINTPNSETSGVILHYSGGNPPYTITWQINGENQSTILNDPSPYTVEDLPLDEYTIEIIDSKGCSTTCPFIIEPYICELSISHISGNINCIGAMDGFIDLTIIGAIEPYTINWNNGIDNNEQNPTLLEAGTYIAEVSDAIGCVKRDTVIITEPLAISVDCTQASPVSTLGGNDATVNIEIGGGIPPYLINWEDPITGTQSMTINQDTLLTNFSAGMYEFQIRDSNNCEIVCTTNITQPDCSLALDLSGMPPSCNDLSDGSIDLVLSNATSPFLVTWNNGIPDNELHPSGLSAGNYAVTVQDNVGCVVIDSIMLIEPPMLQLNGTVLSHPDQNQNNGSVEIEFSGGIPSYFLHWTNGALSDSTTFNSLGSIVLDTLSAGNYTFTFRDSNNCETTFVLVLINIIQEVINDDCSGALSLPLDEFPDCFGIAENNFFGNNFNATQTIPLNIPSNCDGDGTFDSPSRDIWFKFIPATDSLFISLFGLLTPNIILYSGDSCDDLNSLYCYSSSPDSGQLEFGFNPIVGQLYHMLVSGGDTTDVGEFTLVIRGIFPPVPVIDQAATTDTICQGETAPLAARAGFNSYQWSTGGTSMVIMASIPQTYTVTVTDSAGCEYTETVILEVNDNPIAMAGETQFQFCGESITLDGSNSSSGANISFLWNGLNGEIVDNNMAINPSVQDIGFYQLRVSDLINDCYDFDTVAVQQGALEDINAGQDTTICDDTYLMNAVQLPQTNGIWTSLGSALTVDDTLYNTMVFDLYPGPNEFMWTLSNEDCSDLGSSSVTIIYDDVIAMDDFRTLTTQNRSVEIDILGNDVFYGSRDSLTIEILEGPSSGFLNIIDQGIYDYAAGLGFQGQDSIIYRICELDCNHCDIGYIWLDLETGGNQVDFTFTPNGDEYNETFDSPIFHQDPSGTLRVFTKWGTMILERPSYSGTWDGSINNVPLQEATYYYTYTVNNEVVMFGFVAIIRKQ